MRSLAYNNGFAFKAVKLSAQSYMISYTVLIPARLHSSRLPQKPLADIAGTPMIVRVAQQAARSQAARVVVAADDDRILQACKHYGIEAVLTKSTHASGSDRLAEACNLLQLPPTAIVVNVQGDEPLINPSLIDALAQLLDSQPQASMGTAAYPIDNIDDFKNPNIVKVVLNASQAALYFSRAPIAWWRDGFANGIQHDTPLPTPHPLRHIGIYSYRVDFLHRFSQLPQAPLEITESLEQLRALWHGYAIAVHTTSQPPGIGVDTPEDLAQVRALFQP